MRIVTYVALAVGFVVMLPGAAFARTHISETGSTLLFPMMATWSAAFGKLEPDVRVDVNATGSGVGISSAMSGFAELGASDAFLTDAQVASGTMLDVPLAVSGVEVVYNVPELRGGPALRLSGPVLAGIYDGSIASWDAPEIVALNPGRALPHHDILPVRREDASGDTSLFTEYLSLTTPSWAATVRFGTSVTWPKNKKSLFGTGNAGMIDASSNAAYSIAYLGISYAERARAFGLEVAALKNKAGGFVEPSAEVFRATADSVAAAVPADGRESMVDTAGPDAYPIVNFEYAVLKNTQRKKGMAQALRDFLTYVVTPTEGNDPAVLGAVHFAPLPARVRDIALRQISSITGP
jgi:phosphate transport system substrate-binding protein